MPLRNRVFSIGLCAALSLVGCADSRRPPRYGDAYRSIEPTSRDTDTARADNDKALALMRAGKYAEAESRLKDALTADVTYGPAHNNLGTVYFRQSKLYQAAVEYEYASKLMPDQPEPRNNLGLVFEATGRMSDAVGYYDRAVALAPDDVEFVGNAARARVRRGDRTDDVRRMLDKLIATDTRPDWAAWELQARRKLDAATEPAAE